MQLNPTSIGGISLDPHKREILRALVRIGREKFGNNIDDSSDGIFGWYEGTGPSNAPCRDAEDDSSDDSDGSDDGNEEEDPEEESSRAKTQEKGIVREG